MRKWQPERPIVASASLPALSFFPSCASAMWAALSLRCRDGNGSATPSIRSSPVLTRIPCNDRMSFGVCKRIFAIRAT